LKFLLFAAAAASCLPLASSEARGQSYPSKPIRFIVPYAPGGSANMVARTVAQKMTGPLGQQVVVDNRPGANGQIGMDIVAKAAPDGYTVVLGYISNLAIDPSLYAKLSFDPVKDFAPITELVSTLNVLVVHPSVPAKNLKEMIAYAKANPDKMNFSSSGIGSVGHLTGELLNRQAGIHMVHVQYKGSGQAVIDLLAGQVQAMFSGFSSTLQQIRAGKLKAIAVTSARRSPAAPDIPTIAESGFPGFEATAWHGMLAPAGTPRPVISRLHDEAVKALAAPDVQERLAALGFDVVGSTPEEFRGYIQSEIRKWAPVVKASGVKPE
jgi:tripartite-type tricarboxylate transporter receptor subunit TctC